MFFDMRLVGDGTQSVEAQFVAALRSVVGDEGGGLHDPLFDGREKEYLSECIDSGFVSTVGPFVSRFEAQLADFVDAVEAVAVVNGTSGLHLAMVGLGVKPGDEVIVPALSFVATASAVAMAGAIPHFVDVSKETWGISPQLLRRYLSKKLVASERGYVNRESGRPVTGLLAMHTLGFPCDSPGLAAVAREFGLFFVEDAAEALGSFADGRHVGHAGDASVFSFNGNKTITTGGGGAVITRDKSLALRIRHLSTTAKVHHRYQFIHDDVGFNYRMPNINAALGLAQLERLNEILGAQRALHGRYEDALGSLGIGEKRGEVSSTKSNYWLHAFTLGTALAHLRDSIIEACLEAGLAVRPLWFPLNNLEPYKDLPSTRTPIAQDLFKRVICLPSSASLAFGSRG